MSGRYLTDLADVLRRAGLTVIEEPGWQTRARSSGGYASGRPTHFMVHHTASNASSDGQQDVDYMVSGSDDAPIANTYVNRNGVVWVMAAGCTNTNGKGGPLDGVPADSMNTYAVSCEVANNGVGEPYPDPQQRAVATLVRACCNAYGIANAHVSTHYLWAPERKCDNTGPSRWAPPGTPGGCNGAGAWNMPAFRSDVASGWPGGPPAVDASTAESEANVIYFVSPANEANPSLWASNVATKWLVKGTTMRDSLMAVQLVRLTACGMDEATARGFNQVFVCDEGNFRAYGLAVGPDGDLAGRDAFGWAK